MRNNTVNTQGRAGSQWGGHGVGPVPEPLTFCHKSLRSELPLNVFGKVRCLALAPEGPVLSCTPSFLQKDTSDFSLSESELCRNHSTLTFDTFGSLFFPRVNFSCRISSFAKGVQKRCSSSHNRSFFSFSLFYKASEV